MKLSAYDIYVLFTGFSVVIPIGVGIVRYQYLNKSLKIFWFWLLFYLIFSSVKTFMAFNASNNTQLEYLNTIVSFVFLYFILAPHWQSNKVKYITIGGVLLVSLVTILDYFHLFSLPNIDISSTFQTFCWLLMVYYYMVRLLNSENVGSLKQYPMFWIALGNILVSVASLIYYLLMGSAIKFSWTSYLVIENIAFSSVFINHILYIVGLWKTKNGFREIIKV